jgi:ParB family chromosome partitioning protein
VEKRVLPKVGDKIPIDQFFISKTNMRADEPFGQTDEDRALIQHLSRTSVVQPFKARPEDREGHWKPGRDLSEAVGYGVVVGGRRFQALKEAGLKELTVGQHVWIEELTDEEAMDASLKENLQDFQRAPDPVTRARAINAYLSRLPRGLAGLAAAWGIPKTTLSEYLKVLELSPAMQRVVQKRAIPFRDALATARLGLGEELQTRLAETVETQGTEAFKRELARLMAGEGKRGIPAGVYYVVRAIFDKRNRDHLRYIEALEGLAQKEGLTLSEYSTKVLIEHAKSVLGA